MLAFRAKLPQQSVLRPKTTSIFFAPSLNCKACLPQLQHRPSQSRNQQRFATSFFLPRARVLAQSFQPDVPIRIGEKAAAWGSLMAALCALLFLQSATADEKEEQTIPKGQKAQQTKRTEPTPSATLSECSLPIEKAVFTYAPQVPPPITRKHPVLLQVPITTIIKELPIDTAYTYEMWTFNGGVPGPFLRARVGDVMEVFHQNTDPSGMQHNIDWHCVHGPGGGAALLTADQDETKRARFRLLRPGLFIYHCSVDPIGVHVSNGMYGLMLVEPEEGLSKVDKEYFLVQSEIYTEELKRDAHTRKLESSYTKGLDEDPNYVVFNGRMGAHIADQGGVPLKANAGDRVRLFVGNAGPNLISSFHVIGGIMDKVYREGDLVNPPARNIQTTLIPSGGVSMVEMDLLVPGTYAILDHALFRLEKGAVAHIDVVGTDRPDIYQSEEPPKRCPNCKVH